MVFKQQETHFTCGPAAIRNCLIQLGIEPPSELNMRVFCNTDKEGTNMSGLKSGAKHSGLLFKEIYSRSSDVFGRKLLKALKAGHPCIILVDSTTHWIAAVQYKKRKIKIVDGEYAANRRKIEQDLTLKELKLMAHNFNKFNKKDYFHFLELWLDPSK
jgi:ABC-type bacteriocin/lantibiotic exporter with double-glycine peptidase domain